MALAPLLGLCPLVLRSAPPAAERFDTGLYLLGMRLDTLRRRGEVDSEVAMERVPPQIAERRDVAAKALRDGAAALCAALDKERRIIGYCPDCRALYCPAHYETRETWSGSWLEALHGTCATGHRRELA